MSETVYTRSGKKGTYKFTPTERDHMHVEGEVTVRGKTMRVGAHFYLWDDGQWRLGVRAEQEYERKRQAHFSGPYSGMATPAFFEGTMEDMVPVVNAWAKDNAKAIADAEAEYMESGLKYREEQAAQHEKALAILRDEIGRMRGGEHMGRYPKIQSYDADHRR